MTMTDNDHVGAILKASLPDECDAVGNAVVDRIVQGQPISPPQEGRRMDVGQVIEALSAAVAFINGVVTLWRALKPKLRRNPTKDELVAAVRKDPPPAGSLSDEQREQLIEAVAQKQSGS